MINNILSILKSGNNSLLYQIGDEKVTYLEGYHRVVKIADNLKKQGNSPVILYGHKSINQFLSILACVVCKRSYIPIDLCTPIKRIKQIIALSKATLLIKNEDVMIDGIECLTLDELDKKYTSVNNCYEINNDIAYIIFTSGSTGISKGVPISYENLNHFIEWVMKLTEFNDTEGLNILSQASFSFDLSLMDIYFGIYKYCHIIAIPGEVKENVDEILKIILARKIEFLIMTPTFIKMLLIDQSFNMDKFKNIKYMFFCGETLEVETAKKIRERFPHVKIINAYGPTEATCCVSLLEVSDDFLNSDILPVGKMNTSAVNIEVVDNEIVLKGKSVFDSYLGIESNNCYKEGNVNCYRTGDIGFIKGNYLYCNGRLDSQIKYQGYRIELADIENNLLKIEGITNACVIAKYKDNTNIVRLIKAFVTIDNDITDLMIKEELAKLVPHYMIPKKIVILDEMPVNDNGKYDRKKLSNL